MKKILYTLLVGAMALTACDKSDEAPEKKPDDGGGKIEKVCKVGDFCYQDKTFSSTYTSDDQNPCIGIVFWVDETDKSYDATAKTAAKGKIVSLRWEVCKWSAESIVTGATSQTDGAANTAKVLALESYTVANYPAFAWCVAKNTPAIKGINWYLPANSELGSIYANKAILNTALALVDGAETLRDSNHWSSTEGDRENAQYVSLITGSVGSNSKILADKVRAVSAF